MSTTDHGTDRPTHNGWGICEGCGAFVDPAELDEAGTCTRCQATPPSTNQTSQTNAKGAAPVLRPGVLYFAHDRIVCATIRCAGSCALFTGVTTGGAVLSPRHRRRRQGVADLRTGPDDVRVRRPHLRRVKR